MFKRRIIEGNVETPNVKSLSSKFDELVELNKQILTANEKLSSDNEYFKQKQDEGMKDVALSEEQIRHSIEERKAARAQKNWKRADEIRDELLSKGLILEDGPQGTTWKVKT